MSTSWNTLLLFAFFGAVALVYFLYKKGYTLNMPGIPDSIRNFSQWDKVMGVAAAMTVVFMITRLFSWIFPKLSEAYLLRGGPYNLLIVAAAVIALLGLIWPGKTRTTLLSIMGVLVGGAILTALLPAIWEVVPSSSSSSTQTARTVQTVGVCDGVKRTYQLSANDTLVNGGADCRLIEWGRDNAVTVLGANRQQTFPAGPGGDFDFRATRWKCATSTTCLVAAVFVRN